jgi:hypothetical protein
MPKKVAPGFGGILGSELKNPWTSDSDTYPFFITETQILGKDLPPAYEWSDLSPARTTLRN